jgi:hypothetical protein
MATAAMKFPKRRRRFETEVHHGQRVLPPEEGKLLLLAKSEKMRLKRERDDLVRAMARRPVAGDTASVRFAMRCIEQRIVKGLWVQEITTDSDGPRAAKRHGIGYMPEDVDQWSQAVAKGGWVAPPPAPPVPSPKEVTAAQEAIGWIDWLDEGQARLLRTAAITKRGDRERRVNWEWVKGRLSLPEKTPYRTLQDRYDRALRLIVAELTIARCENLE